MNLRGDDEYIMAYPDSMLLCFKHCSSAWLLRALRQIRLHAAPSKQCLTAWLVQVADDLNPMRVLSLFSAITTEDCILLDVADRPEYLIMTHIPVPPVCIRPSVEMDSGQGSNEDDLTVRLRVWV